MEVGQQVETSLCQGVSSDASMENDSSNVMQVKKLLSRKLLVGIEDGRFFLGMFYCLDKKGNIILQDAVEFRSTKCSSPSPMEQRCLGLIIIPSSCITSCHLEGSLEEQPSSLSVRGTSGHVERSIEEELSSLSVRGEVHPNCSHCRPAHKIIDNNANRGKRSLVLCRFNFSSVVLLLSSSCTLMLKTIQES